VGGHYWSTSSNEHLRFYSQEHYKAFAHALPHHANLSMALTNTQAELSEARTHLMESRDALGNKRADLVQLWSRGQTLEEMMRLLDEM
jgi:Exocyst complex component Sec8 N-terminal